MDRIEAAALLRSEVASLAQRSRAELTAMVGSNDAYPIAGAGGVAYQVEVDVLWDRVPGGPIRLMASIDDGGFRSALSPVVDGFLSHPDGRIEMA